MAAHDRGGERKSNAPAENNTKNLDAGEGVVWRGAKNAVRGS